MRVTFKRFAQAICVCTLFTAGLMGQTVSSALEGIVVDPASAVVPSATVTATSTDTGTTRTVVTDNSGLFRFLDLAPGTYSVSVHATGFKGFTQNGVVLVANETRRIGNIELTIGNTSETITVMAEAASIQLASSEKAEAIEGAQLSNVTLRGRDIFGYLKLIPGVVDNSYNGTNAGNRDVTSPNAIRGITINGNTSALNFAVDGITDLDTGSNSTIHFEPNADAVQEMKVLTSNYQAEFGRNSGGTITVVTKNGTQQFHGSFVWNHRNEGFNANQWENNRNGRNSLNVPNSPIAKYRFNVETYTIGGPIFIPKVFNRNKNKLFFFWSQEYTGQYVSGGSQTKYTPTALERGGDFSKSFNNNGSLTPIIDPLVGTAFPGNVVPGNRITPLGQAMLNFFPLPNIVGTGSQANIVNYFESASATHPRRNDVLRVDVNPTSKLSGYFRYINDHDDMIALYQGVQFSSDVGGALGQAGIAPIDHPNPGHGYSGTITYSISPTLINEFTVGESWNTWSYYTTDGGKSQDRSLLPSPPSLFPIPTTNPSGASATNGYFNLLPEFQFGGIQSGASAMSFTRVGTSAGNYENFNTIWTFLDNISKIVGKHTIKGGVYIEKNNKIQPSTPAYEGNFNFSPDTNNALGNTTNGYANGLLGYVDSYSQTTARAVFNTQYWNAEFYIQDNFKVTPRLTLDVGLRFYHQTPQIDLNKTFSNFFPSQYTASAAPRIYVPGTSGGKRVAIDPGTNTVAPVAYIGLYVPNSGNPADGMALLGVNGTPQSTYNQSALALAPRFGFAYDLTGDGKTALRGGFGIYYNRLDGNQVYALSGQAPYSYSPQVNYTTFAQIATSGGALVFGPSTINSWPTAQVPWDRAQNASINIQRSITRTLTIDVGYSGDWGYNQQLSYDINPIPIGTRAPFNPKNADATNGNKTLPDILLRTKFPSFNTVNTYNHLGSSNYNAMTTLVQDRLSNGLVFGAAYTWSRAMGLAAFNPVVPNNTAWNYGRQGFDRRQNFQLNWSYALPNLGQHMHSKILGGVTDHWTLSGILSIQSGPPFNPGFSIVGGTPDYTGTPDVGARINVIGDPFHNVPAGLYFNPAAFAPPAIGTNITTPVLGNLGGGSGTMSLPHYSNVDATMSKFIPFWGERRGLKLQAQAYNVFNHPEFVGIGSGMTFDANGNQTSLTAGVFNGTLPARVMAFSARFEF